MQETRVYLFTTDVSQYEQGLVKYSRLCIIHYFGFATVLLCLFTLDYCASDVLGRTPNVYFTYL